ncbi:MAG TPA: DUF2249 domain-containing protein [Edaphocola sp.]|nr:DUF2249 domain-containing protein [Edaphocola sp.]
MEATNQEIDVRVLIPIKRHELLLKMFSELPVGEDFTFINDHDPLPLYYEFRSIHGDVVGWDYLNKGGRDWKVKVTRTESSQGREFTDISTLMDLRKVEAKDWKHVIFHRYGMMKEGDTMELIALETPEEIQQIFNNKFAGHFTWTNKKETPGEYVIHITKNKKSEQDEKDITVVKDFDARPFPPAERHEMVFNAFDDLKAGEAFVFTNDHDPKPLYYQIEAESNESFSWEYLEDGPDAWRVKVTKTLS